MTFIKTIVCEGKQVCFASEMYKWFEVEITFEEWVEEFLFLNKNFEQTVDFEHCLVRMPNGETKDDYILQMYCATEVSMVQTGKKGREARQYYIDCEKVILSTNTDDTLSEFFLRVKNCAINDQAKEDLLKLIENLENGFREQ